MIQYNITFNLEPEIEEEWLSWMTRDYLSFMTETGLFEEIKILRLLNEIENQGITYSVQCISGSLEKINTYLEEFAPKIVERHNQLFKYKHVSFMTILEQVDY